MELRDYQASAIDRLYQGFESGDRAQIVTSPTGSGKTAIAATVIREAARGRQLSLFVAPMIELVSQAAEHLRGLGLRVAVLQGDNTDLVQYPDVVVASIQTIHSRGWPPSGMSARRPEVVFIDECHILHKAHLELFEWPAVQIVGLTATPLRADLGKYFQRMVVAATIRDLVDQGYLAEAKIFCPGQDDMRRILRKVDISYLKNDFNEGQLSDAMSTRAIVGDVVETWMKRAKDRRTLLFACTVRHAEILCERFNVEGVDAEIVTHKTPKEERQEIIGRFRSGDLQMLCSVDALSIGFDVPAVDCLIMARPTLSQTVYIQQAGRGLRIAEGKRDVVILDHAGNTMRFGPPVAFDPPALGEGEARASKKTVTELGEYKECPTCDYVMERGVPTCPECGYDYPVRGARVVDVPGELREMGKPPDPHSVDEKRRWYQALKHIQLSRGYKPGYTFKSYLSKFDEKPPWSWQQLPPEPPGMDVLNWDKYQRIRYAKRRSA